MITIRKKINICDFLRENETRSEFPKRIQARTIRMALVPSREMSRNPASKVPTMLPIVESA